MNSDFIIFLLGVLICMIIEYLYNKIKDVL